MLTEKTLLFGAPIHYTNREIKAIKSAYLIRSKFYKALNEWLNEYEIKSKIDIVIGINKGNVIAGNIGSEHKLNYTAIGDNVNFASRLCSNAKPGEILISESIYRKIKNKITNFKIIKKEPIKVKGKEGLHSVYNIA